MALPQPPQPPPPPNVIREMRQQLDAHLNARTSLFAQIDDAVSAAHNELEQERANAGVNGPGPYQPAAAENTQQ